MKRTASQRLTNQHRSRNGASRGTGSGLAAPRPAFERDPRAPFPHRAAIERGLGVGIPGTWSVDPRRCHKLGVQAVTAQTHTHFASPRPPLHVAAHEAVHQVQHAGLTHDGFLGAEGHADRVAGRLVRGQPARELIGARGHRVPPRTRGYTFLDKKALRRSRQWSALVGVAPLKVAETGDAVTAVAHKKVLYASKAAVKEANAILKRQRAGITLRRKLTKKARGKPPAGGATKTLFRIVPKFPMHRGSWDQRFYEDCGRAAREAVGPSGEDRPLAAVCRNHKEEFKTAPSKDPARLRAWVLMEAGLGSTEEEALAAYQQMDEEEAQRFDEKYGLNRFAAPKVGEAFTMVEKEAGAEGWAFHWATVILHLGDDRVTFENAARSGTEAEEDKKNREWGFAMYGPPGTGIGQTYYDEWAYQFGERSEGAMAMAAVQSHFTHKPTEGIYSVLPRIGSGSYDSISPQELAALSDAEFLEAVSAARAKVQLGAGEPSGRAAQAFLEDRLEPELRKRGLTETTGSRQ